MEREYCRRIRVSKLVCSRFTMDLYERLEELQGMTRLLTSFRQMRSE